MSEEKKKVAVCGTGFGIFYAEAAVRNSNMELTGIVARGSERSVRCAERYGVPLYHDVDELPSDTDIVCVVVRSSILGGSGTDIALKCLSRGMSVILEQPVHHEDLMRLFKTALQNGCAYMTGNLYANLKEIRRFLQVAGKLKDSESRLEYIDCGSSVQAFYPFVEILGRLTGGEMEVKFIDEQRGSFKTVTGEIGKVPFSFRFNNELDPKDPDNHMRILHSISCYYDTGRLELVDSRGPLIWYPRLDIPWYVFDRGGFPETPDGYPEHVRRSDVVMLTPDNSEFEKPYHISLERDWVNSISMDLDLLNSMSSDRKSLMMRAQSEQRYSRQWNELSKKLGYAVLNEQTGKKLCNLNDLKKEAVLPEEKI
ncbi:MAG: Gfo/Idh/MocA family oxidoreductase [Saccharofermentans sp.]|nr:Gfo/Idh/MocA family oxidoreductase [Saccharofermentans sp.]